MLHLLYILAFTVIAFLAIGNLTRSLITVSMESTRRYPTPPANTKSQVRIPSSVHPELLDERGRPINEPLLVMRSVTLDDARQQLDALYQSSPSQAKETDND